MRLPSKSLSEKANEVPSLREVLGRVEKEGGVWEGSRSEETPIRQLRQAGGEARRRAGLPGREPLTEEVQDQVLRGGERVGQTEHGVAATLHFPQGLEVPEEDVAQPLGVHTRDPPLPGFLVL